MRWNILDRNMHVLLSPDTRADASLPIYHDKQTITLKNNCAIGTYDFTVNQQDPDAKALQLGNYISFVDKYGKTRLYTLMSHDGDEYEQTWHAEDIGLDLINEVADKWKYNEPHSFAWYAENLLLYDSGWSIGINEIGNLTRSLTFDGQSDSVLTRLGDLANQFDGAEIDFEVEMSGSAVTKQVINVYKKLGSDLTQQRFVDAVNLKALTTNGSINDLRTAMIGYGSIPDNGGENAEPITFANIEYDDGRYFTLKGDKTVCDRVAGQTWARAGAFDTTNKNALKGYIVGIYTYETKDPNELLKRTITNLKTVNEPQIGYEADLLDLQADIGDTVQIAHRQYNPPIYLSARVQEVENCYTEVGQDTGKLGNYQILESHIDPRIADMVNQVAAKSASYVWVRYADDDKGTNMSILPAGKKYVAVVSVKGNATPSDDPADYAGYWLPLGQDGSNGTPGAPGKDGKTTYNHNAWADDVNGKTGFSTSYADGKLYVGQYSDFTEADSTDPTKYTWARFRGEDGKDGVAGKDGVGIKSTTITYALGESGTATPTTGWTTSVPTLIKGQYLWTQTTWVYTDNTGESGYTVSYNAKDGNNGSNGIAGKDGVGIKNTTITYQSGTSGTVQPTGTWVANPPSVTGGNYLWTRTVWSYTDGTSETGYSVAKAGEKGDKGDKGLQGAKGKDGIAGKDGVGVKATTITYAQSTSGTTPPATGWTAGVPTLIKGQYLWTKTVWTYTDSSAETGYTVSYNAKDGNTGSDGRAGKDGTGIKSTVIEYVGAVSGTSKPTNGWSTTIPTVPAGQYLWTRTTWKYTDGTSEQGFTNALMGRTGATGAKGKDGVAGKDGLGIKSTAITYQLSSSGTTTPTGTWSTTVPTLTKGQYLWTRTTLTYTDNTTEPVYSVSYVAKDGNNGSNGVAGKDGVGIKSTTITYATSTSGTSAPTGGWVSTPPSAAAGQFIWTRTTWTYTDNTTETGYSVGKIGEKGANGKPGADGKGIASTTVNYQASTSGTTIPTGKWLASIPAVAANQYLWTRTTWSYTDNTSANGYSVGKMGSNGDKGDKGDTGNGIKSVVASYQNATSGTVIPTGSWAANPPNTPQGQYLWTRNLTTFTNGGTSTSYSVAYSAKDGQKGDKGDPGSDNVPYMYTQTTTPSKPKPKENDIWFVGTNWQDASAIKRYVGGTWVTDNFSQAIMTIKRLDAIEINGSVINGSSFINSFDYKDEMGQRYVGTTTIQNGIVTMQYTIPEVSMQGKVSMSPQGFQSIQEPVNNTDASKRSYSSIGNNLMILQSPTSYGLISSDDIERTGAETWTMHDPINGDYDTDWNKQFRRCWISGVMVLPAAKFKDYKLLFTLKNKKLWPKKTRFLTLQSLGNPPIQSATIQIEVNGRISCIANAYDGTRFIVEGANYSLD